MSLILDLTADVENRLQAEADQQGLPAADVACRLIEMALPPLSKIQSAETALAERPRNDAEWDAIFDSLSASAGTQSALLETAFSRENIYAGHD